MKTALSLLQWTEGTVGRDLVDHARRFEELGLPADMLSPYLGQVVRNFVDTPDTALTGPLVRGDWQTIERNLQSLEGDSLQPLYRAFLEHWNAEGAESPRREVAS